MFRDFTKRLAVLGSIAPGSELSGTTAVAGTWVDAKNIIGPVAAIVHVGAATGAPTAQAHSIKVRCADNASGDGAEDITDATATVTAAGAVIVQANNREKRFVQVYVTPAFTGGTTPKNTVSAVVIGQKDRF